MTIELNEQQVEFLRSLLEADLIRSEFSNTSKAIALQIINKLEN